MGDRGPVPTPKALRLLKNDKAHAHLYKDIVEPIPSGGRPEPPSYLSERAREIFIDFVNRIEDMYPPSDTDMDTIVLYSNNKEQLECYELVLREEGSTYEVIDKLGNIIRKARPEVTMLKDCKALQVTLLREFGISPSARGRVNLKPKETKKENPFAAVSKKQKQG